ncbi:MAG: SGNH/GDSL hydrolase family protein [Actinobacteria bacterium]|nr:SGNH/GDSL hydrolase family protein [Actinomycetota bacterium]
MKRMISLVLTALMSLVTVIVVAAPTAHATAGPVKVVSLGDSFAAASTLATTYQTDALCDRSSLGYPYLLKKFSQSPSVDVACGGAVTRDLFAGRTIGATTLPPQLAALTSSTKVVTLTVGGNDVGFSQLAQCLATAMTIGDPTAQALAVNACLQPLSDSTALGAKVYAMSQGLAASILAIHTQAPEAQIFVSDYPVILGLNADGTCPTIPQLPAGVIALVDGANAQLNTTIGAVVIATAGAGVPVTLVDVAPSFTGHGVCSTSPLINGFLHPSAQGQQVYADAFNAAIKQAFAA